MTEIEQTAEELRQLREKQALHRRQLEENRQKALDKKKQTRRYVNLGKMVEGMIPGADRQSEDEILDYLEKHLPFSRNRHRKPASLQKKRRALTLLF